MPSDDPAAGQPPLADGDLAPGDAPAATPTQASGVRDAGRYHIGEAVAGDLHRGRDRLLDRAVDLRVADSATAGDLEREARFVARLAHPGIAAVHDLVRGDAGALLVLDRVDGVTLAEAIAEARDGRPRPELASPAAAVLLVRRVCDALAAAHARGVVHRAVDPGAIILGWHGQVVLGSWRTAMAASERPVTRRFVAAAAAPQVVDLDDLHVDVRALGACLYHALALRPPPETGDLLAGLGAGQRSRLPPQLLAIIRHALASRQTIGYHSIAEFGEDLDRWLAGQQALAYEPGLWLRFSAWLHRRRRAVVATVVAVGLALIGGLALDAGLDRWLHRWGRPLVAEEFSDNSWRDRWVESSPGAFIVAKDRLVSQAPHQALLVYRQRLVTPVAIEYTGQILPGTRACDLSVWWSERDGLPQDPSKITENAQVYMIQAGAVDNSYCAIFQVPPYRRVAHANRRLEVGRDYRFRVELDGQRISMDIDGERVLEYRSALPTTSGYLALYGYYPGKAFDDVRIYQRHAPAPVSPLTAGDALYQFHHYADAASAYARIAESYPGQAVGQQALFRKGLAERDDRRPDAARDTWIGLSDRHLSRLADCYRLDELLAGWQIDPLCHRFENYYRERPEVRPELRRQWQDMMVRLAGDQRRDEATVLRFIGLRDALFPDDSASAYEAILALLRMDRYQEILVGYPEERASCRTAMLALGRIDEVLAMPGSHGEAHFICGDFDGLGKEADLDQSLKALVMCKRGWAREALRDLGDPYPAQLYLGQAEELLTSLKTRPHRVDAIANECLIALGRYEEAAGAGIPDLASGKSWRAMILCGRLDDAAKAVAAADYWSDPIDLAWARLLQAEETGDAAGVATWRPQVGLPRNLARQGGWFAGVVVAPFIDGLHGDAKALPRALAKAEADYARVFTRRPWFLARYVLGECSEQDVLNMPSASEGPAWLAIGKGLRAELAGRPAEALAAYRAFTDLPRQQRLLENNTLDVEVELFAAWRLRALAAVQPAR